MAGEALPCRPGTATLNFSAPHLESNVEPTSVIGQKCHSARYLQTCEAGGRDLDHIENDSSRSLQL